MRILRWASRLWTGFLFSIVLMFGLLLGLRFLLPFLPLSTRPEVTATTPAPGAPALPPRSQITVRFTTPMNPRSVERALSLSPAAPFITRWSDQQQTLEISPTQSLQAGVDYQLKIDETAQSRMFQPLSAPILVAFQTLSPPVVVAHFPEQNARNVSVDSPISISFSRPIVPTDTLTLPQETPLLQFSPELTGTTTWIDPSTALFRPAKPLQIGTRYQAALPTTLVDVAGSALEHPLQWEFSTAAPSVVATTPANEAERVAPSSELTLLLSQPIDPAAVQSALTISPTIQGAFSAQQLPNSTQLITFTPRGGWQPDTRYTAELAAGLMPIGGNIPQEQVRWSFRTAPQPALVGRFPGDQQVLPVGQEVRLIFNTLVQAEAIERNITITPPVEGLRVRANGNEARIAAQFTASTAYTLTLAADVVTDNGVPLGQDYVLHFLGAPAAPTLNLPEARDHLLHLSPGDAGPQLQASNITNLNADLFALDADTVVRLLAFTSTAWADFSPERYGLTPQRSWTTSVTTTLERRFPLTADGAPLAEGAYYLRLRAGEQLQAESVVLVSNTNLTLRQRNGSGVVWATDQNGIPQQQIALALYRDGALIGQGTTDPNGIWSFRGAGSGAQLVALSTNGALAMTNAPASEAAPSFNATLLTDRTSYQPGDTLHLSGFVRATDPISSALAGLRGSISLHNRATAERSESSSLQLRDGGLINESLILPHSLTPGSYLLTVALGSQRFTTDITIERPQHPAPELRMQLSAAILAGEPLTMTLHSTLGAFPLAGTTITWTLQASAASPTSNAAAPFILRGSGQSDHTGQLSLVISDSVQLAQPMLMTATAELVAPDGTLAIANATSRAFPAQSVVEIGTNSQIAAVNQPFDVALQLNDQNQQPLGDQLIEIALFRASDSQTSAPIERQQLRSDANGRATAQITPTEGGIYRIQASVRDSAGRQSIANTPLWVRAEGFNNWPVSPTLPLIADRPTYRAGDVATLLIAAPINAGDALIAVGRRQGIEGTVQPLTPSGMITVTIAADDPSPLPVEVLIVPVNGGSAQVATTMLPITTDQQLKVLVASDTTEYAPNSKASVAIATTDQQGQPIAAHVVLGLFDTAQNTPLAWNNDLRTDATGALSITLPLSSTATMLEARVWAVDSLGRTGMARTSFAITQPLALELSAPPRLFAGDQVLVEARLRNTSSAAQRVNAIIQTPGLTIEQGQRTSIIDLPPGSEQTLRWQMLAGREPTANIQLTAQIAQQPTQVIRRSWQIETAGATETANVLVNGRWAKQFDGATSIEVIPSAAALQQATRAALLVNEEHNAPNAAALLQLTAPSAGTRAQADDALATLLATQQFDGGWNWAASDASDPDVTLAALRGLALARRAGLIVPDIVIRRALDSLHSETSSAPLQARALYAQSLFGEAEAEEIRRVAAAPESLDASGIALLLLAQQPDALENRALADALLARLISDQRGARAAGSGPGGDATASAFALQALSRERPGAPILNDLAGYLVAERNNGAWSDPLAAAAATEALSTMLPTLTPVSYELAFNNNPIATISGENTSRLFTLPQGQLTANSTLSLASSGGPIIASVNTSTPIAAENDNVLVLREYLDPQNNQPFQAKILPIGQLVRVRLTVLPRQPWRFITLYEPIPGGTQLVETGRGDFAVDEQHNALLLRRSAIEYGVYEYQYTLQLVAPGTFTLAAPQVRTSDGALLGQGQTGTLTIGH